MNRSTFPTILDTFLEHYDLQASDVTNVNRWTVLTKQSSLTPTETSELNSLTTTLRAKLFTPEDFNKLQDCITNMETFIRDNVEGYIAIKQIEFQASIDGKEILFDAQLQEFSDKGDYSPATTYKQWNTVSYGFQTYLSRQNGNVNHTPAGVTDSWWQLMAVRGATGLTGTNGLGLTFIGNYNAGTTYYIGNAVNFNNNIYYCINTTTGNDPSNLGYWALFLSNSGVAIQTTAPTSPYANLVWIDSSTAEKIMKYWDGATWVVCGNLASNITIADVGGLIIATTVEGALQEIAGKAIIQNGSGTFNSTTGVVITHSVGNTNFSVSVTPTSDPAGYLGEIRVAKTATNFTVFCSGSTTTTTFDYTLSRK